MLVKEFLFHSTCWVRNGNLLKTRVSEIRVNQIRVNQGLGVCSIDFETKLKIDTSKILNGFVPYYLAIHLSSENVLT